MRARLASLLTLALGLFAAEMVSSSPASAAAPLPGQIVTVQVAAAASTTGRLDLWQLSTFGGYRHMWGPVPAFVGELGVGKTADSIPRTPAGTFGLTQAFGSAANNGTRLPYFQTGPSDWWNGERNSPAYNTHVRQASSPGPNSENLYYAGPVYAHAVVINYNMAPVVPGAGSAFFLHVTNGQPTAGCVAVASSHLDTIMRWLNPAMKPVISIGVGGNATAIIRAANAEAATHNPFGYLDSVSGGPGNVRAQGWAADPDMTAARLLVDVYVDRRMFGRYATGISRPDVALAKHTGPNQGFDVTAPMAAGNHSVCVYALNVSLGTANTLLGCRSVAVG
jgi:L,D-peptidoglycan transpeptidase YkuD (ErfK/YbiS/YcfS/YnhG family)